MYSLHISLLTRVEANGEEMRRNEEVPEREREIDIERARETVSE